ncbi:MAG: UvrB/UvrC motif-containing protein [Gemmatimonadota bacterium]
MGDQNCQKCGSTDAVVHLTQIVNDEMTTQHLCESCAKEMGFDTGPSKFDMPAMDVLAQMAAESPVERATAEACSFCGLTYHDFKKTGRLGCPHCYETFAASLPALLKKIHGDYRHVGKVYLPPDPTVSDMERQLDGLRRKLERAVQSEDFERAAELRDQIRSLEPA